MSPSPLPREAAGICSQAAQEAGREGHEQPASPGCTPPKNLPQVLCGCSCPHRAIPKGPSTTVLVHAEDSVAMLPNTSRPCAENHLWSVFSSRSKCPQLPSIARHHFCRSCLAPEATHPPTVPVPCAGSTPRGGECSLRWISHGSH